MSETEQNQPNNNGSTPTPAPPAQPRAPDGKFAPKSPVQNPPVPTPEPAKPTNTPTTDTLLDTIEKDFREGLKEHPILNELEGLDQRTRIRMLRAVAKTQSETKKKEPINPMGETPPTEQHIPTLLELNQADKFRADMRQQNSYLNMAQKMRKGER